MFERGGQKWSGGEKKIQNFKFECLKWPILAGMTAKSGIYSHFLCQEGGDMPTVVLRGETPPWTPLAETLVVLKGLILYKYTIRQVCNLQDIHSYLQ